MAIKVNDHIIPDWAIERQASSLFEQVAKTMSDKPREVIQLAAIDMAKDRMIDQALMAQESQRREYEINSDEINLGMKNWISQNGGKKAFAKGKHPVIKNQEDLRKEVINQIKFNRLLEEESKGDEVTEDDAKKYYETRPDLFQSEVLLTASHLLKWPIMKKSFRPQKVKLLRLEEKLKMVKILKI